MKKSIEIKKSRQYPTILMPFFHENLLSDIAIKFIQGGYLERAL